MGKSNQEIESNISDLLKEFKIKPSFWDGIFDMIKSHKDELMYYKERPPEPDKHAVKYRTESFLFGRICWDYEFHEIEIRKISFSIEIKDRQEKKTISIKSPEVIDRIMRSFQHEVENYPKSLPGANFNNILFEPDYDYKIQLPPQLRNEPSRYSTALRIFISRLMEYISDNELITRSTISELYPRKTEVKEAIKHLIGRLLIVLGFFDSYEVILNEKGSTTGYNDEKDYCIKIINTYFK